MYELKYNREVIYMDEKEFGMRLSVLRNQKGVSARDMSLSIGQNPAYINHIENGRSTPSFPVFTYICEYLGISEKEFFDIELSNLSDSLLCPESSMAPATQWGLV